MSNVLMGLIGVILIIGLAFAATTYFGSQFQDARNNSRASAALQATAQVAQASNAAYAQIGTAPTVDTDITAQLVTPGFLKSIPSNPVGSAAPALMTAAGVASGGADAEVAVLDLGDSADKVCTSIGKQSGQLANSATTSATGTAFPSQSGGCIKAAAGAGAGLTVGNFYAYTRI